MFFDKVLLLKTIEKKRKIPYEQNISIILKPSFEQYLPGKKSYLIAYLCATLYIIVFVRSYYQFIFKKKFVATRFMFAG